MADKVATFCFVPVTARAGAKHKKMTVFTRRHLENVYKRRKNHELNS